MSDAHGQAGAPRLRPAAARGRGVEGGIGAVEAFSRGHAIDRAWMGWGALRVLSRQDWAPGAARDEGRVANMERLLLVLDGALQADCGALGHLGASAGGALWLGAGHGLSARLANASATAPLRVLECWLQPGRVNAAPAVAVRPGPWPEPGDAWQALAAGGDPAAQPGAPAPASAPATLPLRLDARVLVAALAPGGRVALPPVRGGRAWLEVLDGDVAVSAADGDGPALAAGDGLGWQAGDAWAPASVSAGAAGARVLLALLPS